MTQGNVTDLSVVLLMAADAAKTAAFYRDLLEVPLVGEMHDGRHEHFACLYGALYFTIQPAADMQAPQPDGGYDFLQLCFSVKNLDELIQSAARLGVRALHEPRSFEHTTYVTLLDPDGRHVRVMTPWRRDDEASNE
jgi:catechol 2,3-dioxygenase-like lactoylglutathione lyase family enzyme